MASTPPVMFLVKARTFLIHGSAYVTFAYAPGYSLVWQGIGDSIPIPKLDIPIMVFLKYVYEQLMYIYYYEDTTDGGFGDVS